jgi:hypothetical protein
MRHSKSYEGNIGKEMDIGMGGTEIIRPDSINTTSLAFIGDAVYETYVRKYVLA